MNEFYVKSYTIDTTHVDQMNNLRPSVLLSFFQDMATAHAEIMGLTRDYLMENFNACWIVVRNWYTLKKPLKVDQVLTIKTWHRGASPLIVYRDFDLYVGEELVGEAVAAWVIADVVDRKMLRPSTVERVVNSPVPEAVKNIKLKTIRRYEGVEQIFARTVRYSDLDVNGHMNNTKYADLILDAFDPKEMEGQYIGELELNYSKECKWGETMEVSRKQVDEKWYIEGCCGDSERRFEAMLCLREE